ncbi:MAG TPA: tail fiber protein [Acidimicrobiales bacterium]|nr:tail fiber protein [Acidimicrobiales bacterium]
MDPFLAEIRILPFNFAPKGWADCDGQIMPVSQNTTLYSLLGTMYGGNGQSTFALPNLGGSVPVGAGQGPGLSLCFQGQTGGTPTVMLLQTEMPVHSHALTYSANPATERQPPNQQFAAPQGVGYYDTNAQPTVNLAPTALGLAGAGLPHNNMPPYLTVRYCIALQGVFPPRQ